jgi:hypothetical protein
MSTALIDLVAPYIRLDLAAVVAKRTQAQATTITTYLLNYLPTTYLSTTSLLPTYCLPTTYLPTYLPTYLQHCITELRKNDGQHFSIGSLTWLRGSGFLMINKTPWSPGPIPTNRLGNQWKATANHRRANGRG